MTDLLDRANNWLDKERHEHMTKSVRFRREGVVDDLVVSATIGRTEFEVVDEEGFAERTESRDFLIRVEDLPVVPQSGDQIVEIDGSGEGQEVTLTYEVMPFGNNEPAWRYSDPYRKRYRIHTKLRETTITQP